MANPNQGERAMTHGNGNPAKVFWLGLLTLVLLGVFWNDLGWGIQAFWLIVVVWLLSVAFVVGIEVGHEDGWNEALKLSYDAECGKVTDASEWPGIRLSYEVDRLRVRLKEGGATC